MRCSVLLRVSAHLNRPSVWLTLFYTWNIALSKVGAVIDFSTSHFSLQARHFTFSLFFCPTPTIVTTSAQANLYQDP